MPKKNTLETIALYSEKQDNGCILWKGGLSSGYPTLSLDNQTVRVANYLYQLENGLARLPPRTIIKRTCKNKLCVNTSHFSVYDQTLPMEDIRERLKIYKLIDVCRQLNLDYQLVYRALHRSPDGSRLRGEVTFSERLCIRVPEHEEE